METQKIPLQKSYQINTGHDSIDINILGANRKGDWLEILLVYKKSDKRTTIYDSYNIELAAKRVKSLKLTSFTEIYSLTNEKKYEIDNLMQIHLLYKQLVAWSYNGSSVALLSDYMNNPVFQEVISEDDYFELRSDERMCLDLLASSGYVKEAEKLERNDSKINFHIMLKEAATKKLTLRVYVLGKKLL